MASLNDDFLQAELLNRILNSQDNHEKEVQKLEARIKEVEKRLQEMEEKTNELDGIMIGSESNESNGNEKKQAKEDEKGVKIGLIQRHNQLLSESEGSKSVIDGIFLSLQNKSKALDKIEYSKLVAIKSPKSTTFMQRLFQWIAYFLGRLQ